MWLYINHTFYVVWFLVSVFLRVLTFFFLGIYSLKMYDCLYETAFVFQDCTDGIQLMYSNNALFNSISSTACFISCRSWHTIKLVLCIA